MKPLHLGSAAAIVGLPIAALVLLSSGGETSANALTFGS